MAAREPALLDIRFDSGTGGKGDSVEVDGKPLLCTGVTFECRADGKYEVLLRIPAEFCKVDVRLGSDAPVAMRRMGKSQ